MRRLVLLIALFGMAACATRTGGRVVAHQARGVRQDWPPVLVQHLSAGYLHERARAENGNTAHIPPGGLLVVSVAVGSPEHANPENFLVSVAAGGRELLAERGPPMAAWPCGYGCGPTTGLGEVRRRAPCYCAEFAVGLPEVADRFAVTIADAVDRARFGFTVHLDEAVRAASGESSSNSSNAALTAGE